MHGYKEILYPTAAKLNAEAANGWRLKTIYFPKAHVHPGLHVAILEKEMAEGETLDPDEVTAVEERPKSNPLKRKGEPDPQPKKKGRKKG